MKVKISLLTFFTLFTGSVFAGLDRVTPEQIKAAQGIIQYFGYTCDKVDSMNPFVMGTGFHVYCNNFKYSYDLEDKGGKWTVTVQ